MEWKLVILIHWPATAAELIILNDTSLAAFTKSETELTSGTQTHLTCLKHVHPPLSSPPPTHSQAAKKAGLENALSLVQGQAEDLPFESNSFDSAVITLVGNCCCNVQLFC